MGSFFSYSSSSSSSSARPVPNLIRAEKTSITPENKKDASLIFSASDHTSWIRNITFFSPENNNNMLFCSVDEFQQVYVWKGFFGNNSDSNDHNNSGILTSSSIKNLNFKLVQKIDISASRYHSSNRNLRVGNTYRYSLQSSWPLCFDRTNSILVAPGLTYYDFSPLLDSNNNNNNDNNDDWNIIQECIIENPAKSYFPKNSRHVVDVSFSPDNRFFVAAHEDGFDIVPIFLHNNKKQQQSSSGGDEKKIKRRCELEFGEVVKVTGKNFGEAENCIAVQFYCPRGSFYSVYHHNGDDNNDYYSSSSATASTSSSSSSSSSSFFLLSVHNHSKTTAAGANDTVCIWNIRGGGGPSSNNKNISVELFHKYSISQLAVLGTKIMKAIFVYPNPQQQQQQQQQQQMNQTISLEPDCKIAVGGSEGTALFNCSTNNNKYDMCWFHGTKSAGTFTQDSELGEVVSLATSPDGSVIILAVNDKTHSLQIIQTSSGALLRSLENQHFRTCNAIDFPSSSNLLFCTGGQGQTIKVFESPIPQLKFQARRICLLLRFCCSTSNNTMGKKKSKMPKCFEESWSIMTTVALFLPY